jgi:hypothetical protein
VAFGRWGLVAGWYWLAPLLVVYGWLYYDLILFRGGGFVATFGNN